MQASPTFNLNWGILSCGSIAQTFSRDLIASSRRSDIGITHSVVAAATRNSAPRATIFLREIGAPETATAHGSYEALVRDPQVDIVYVASPHSHHYQHTRLALEAGKHVLCEKAFTVNAAQAEALVQLAREKQRFLMEAVWTRFFPLVREIEDVVQRGMIGRVMRVFADLSRGDEGKEGMLRFEDGHRMINPKLAGGALLDLGIYSLTWVFLFLYSSQRPETPTITSTTTKYAYTGVDETTSMLLTFPSSGNQGIATTSLRVGYDPSPIAPIRIQGTHGEILVSDRAYRPTHYAVIERGGKVLVDKTVEQPEGFHGMIWEADECARCVRDGKLESGRMGWRESLEVMKVMDEVRRQGNLTFPKEIESLEFPLEL